MSLYPMTLDGRKAKRKGLRAQILADAERKAQIVGTSMKCGGWPSGYDPTAPPKHAGEPDGCANDGSSCLCWCHDPREVS